MIHAPYKTIWSSATLPAQAQLPTLVENFKRQFDVGNDNVHALTSMPRSSHPHSYCTPSLPTSLLIFLPIFPLRCTSSSRCSSTSACSS